MNKKIVYISDFFLEQVAGGAEFNDSELLKMLDSAGYVIERKQSHEVTLSFLMDNEDSFYIISNFINLAQEVKKTLARLEYVIYEHDHKYLKNRNPATHRDFKAPPTEIVNFYFYKNAKAVICQTDFHKNIVEKNLKIKNVLSIGGNLWSEDVLEKIRSLSKNPKKDACSILESNIWHKNTSGAIKYCTSKGLQYSCIKSPDYGKFLDLLSRNKKFVFFPKSPETLSRIVVEARMLGCSVITNDLVGASMESWFPLKGEELIDYMVEKRNNILATVEEIISRPWEQPPAPLVSIVSTFYEGSEFLPHFLRTTTEQTVFDKCELIIIDANSPGDEQQIVSEYMEKYDNIRYHRLEERLGPTPCFNMAIQMANAEYITFGFIDDVKRNDCIEVLHSQIEQNSNIDLVYGDVAVTEEKNQDFCSFDLSSAKLFDHSQLEFSPENMIKCLPGPMPLWRKDIHEKNGFFDTKNCNYADDWEMWLRAVDSGHEFKKVDDVVGLVLAGGRSQQNNIEQRKEEAKIFYKYSHIFGQNYHNFNSYFRQFLEK